MFVKNCRLGQHNLGKRSGVSSTSAKRRCHPAEATALPKKHLYAEGAEEGLLLYSLLMSNQWQSRDHAANYLTRAQVLPHRGKAEAALLELIQQRVPSLTQVLDLGTGNGHTLALIFQDYPKARGIALDFSPFMLEQAKERFGNNPAVRILQHDLDTPLHSCTSDEIQGPFDLVVSSFAIHHVDDTRKQALYQEIYDRLRPGGFFANLEHVASPTQALHEEFLAIIKAEEDPSNQLANVENQLSWLRNCGFSGVECYWKWREIALLAGTRPA